MSVSCPLCKELYSGVPRDQERKAKKCALKSLQSEERQEAKRQIHKKFQEKVHPL